MNDGVFLVQCGVSVCVARGVGVSLLSTVALSNFCHCFVYVCDDVTDVCGD